MRANDWASINVFPWCCFILQKVKKLRWQPKRKCPNTSLFPGENSVGLTWPGRLAHHPLADTSPTPTAAAHPSPFQSFPEQKKQPLGDQPGPARGRKAKTPWSAISALSGPNPGRQTGEPFQFATSGSSSLSSLALSCVLFLLQFPFLCPAGCFPFSRLTFILPVS